MSRMQVHPHSALVLAGHGSTLNPDSSAPTLDHAETIRRRGVFSEVVCTFWKEEPSMREVLRMVDSPEIYIVPNFISEGYFTQEVLPRELGLDGRLTRLPPVAPGGPERVAYYCDPVGLHPGMTRLLLARARQVAPGVPPQDCSLIIVGHGTGLNENSTEAIKSQVRLIRESGIGFAEVLDAYMEESPLVADWDKLTTAPHVIVVPFFIADGLHSFQDIPVLLGIEEEITAAASQLEIFKQNPHPLRGRQLYYSSAIGTEPLLADVILDQAAAFHRTHQSPPVTGAPLCPSLTGQLASWLEAGGTAIGQVALRGGGDHGQGWTLCHETDLPAAGGPPAAAGQPDPLQFLTTFNHPAAARPLAAMDAAGQWRPLKSAPTLKSGWRLDLPDAAAVHRALDYLYPAAVANWFRHTAGGVPPRHLKGMLARQTGMYKITGQLREDEARELVADVCQDSKCLRRIVWTWDGGAGWPGLPPEKTIPLEPESRPLSPEDAAVSEEPSAAARSLPLLCTDACPIFIGAARDCVKKRLKREAFPSPSCPSPAPAPAATAPASVSAP